jgi:hypothetical protein
MLTPNFASLNKCNTDQYISKMRTIQMNAKVYSKCLFMRLSEIEYD